jgi:hypothetical protein
MARDYFTRAEYRLWFPGTLHTDEQIDGAQAVVIDHIERWARSAWPNVTGVEGDGTAAAPRSRIETIETDKPDIFLERVPVIAVASVTVDGILAVVDDHYTTDLALGIVGFHYGPDGFTVEAVTTYTYGHTSTPPAIKHAAMLATYSYIEANRPDGGGGAGAIPPNVESYTTEGTTFVMRDEDIGDDAFRPFDWDMVASRMVRSFWAPDRPRVVGNI